MTTRRSVRTLGRGVALLAVLALTACSTMTAGSTASPPAGPQYLIVGIDEKVTWDSAGKTVLQAPGRDVLSIVDIASGETPRIVANLPMPNSIAGPPTNLAITPDGRVGIVEERLQLMR